MKNILKNILIGDDNIMLNILFIIEFIFNCTEDLLINAIHALLA